MEGHYPCQLQDIPNLSEGDLPTTNRSLAWRMKLLLKRALPMQTKQRIKHALTALQIRLRGSQTIDAAQPAAPAVPLQAGDWVRVRAYGDIKATLNNWNTLKGCSFMKAMLPYCGTTQRVLKPVNRFLDERDYKMKKCSGLVLLEGAICHGLENYGPCDRSCYYFWRHEWLEKIDTPDAVYRKVEIQ